MSQLSLVDEQGRKWVRNGCILGGQGRKSKVVPENIEASTMEPKVVDKDTYNNSDNDELLVPTISSLQRSDLHDFKS